MLLEREKKIYSHLGRHPAIFRCLEILDSGLRFPLMKSGSLRTFLYNDVPKPPHTKLQWIKIYTQQLTTSTPEKFCQGDVSKRAKFPHHGEAILQ